MEVKAVLRTITLAWEAMAAVLSLVVLLAIAEDQLEALAMEVLEVIFMGEAAVGVGTAAEEAMFRPVEADPAILHLPPLAMEFGRMATANAP